MMYFALIFLFRMRVGVLGYVGCHFKFKSADTSEYRAIKSVDKSRTWHEQDVTRNKLFRLSDNVLVKIVLLQPQK